MGTTRIIQVTAFIDWDTARRCGVKTKRPTNSSKRWKDSIEFLQNSIAEVLSNKFSDDRCRVTLRFYHGWYTGKSKTSDRTAFELEVASCQQNSLFLNKTIKRTSFVPEITYCDFLLSDIDKEYRLYDTLRRREDGREEQKMIDTAISCDVLEFIRPSPDGRLALIVGADDDLLPALFTATTWKRKVFMLRLAREYDNKHLNTTHLIVRTKGDLQ